MLHLHKNQKVELVTRDQYKLGGVAQNNSRYTAKNTIQQLLGARNIDVYVSSLG